MGITDFRKIKDTFMQNETLSNLRNQTRNMPVDVYIDGSFYMYTGFIPQNQISPDLYDNSKVAETVLDYVEYTLQKIKLQHGLTIGKVRVYFDGKKPLSKQRTMLNRRERNLKIQNLQNIRTYITRMFNNCNFEINNLIIGEAEHEMFIHRNAARPSIMLTDDSDLFHIAYNYDSRTVNDVVFLGTKSLNFTCNLQKLTQTFKNMPKMVFSLLCALRGSDFTCDTFTVTMMKAILCEFKKPSNAATEDILNTLYKLTQGYQEQEYKVQYKSAKLKSSLYNEVHESDEAFCTNDEEMEEDEEEDEEKYALTYVTMSQIYSEEDTLRVMQLLLQLLHRTSNKFTWNVSKVSVKDEPDVSMKALIYEQFKAIHWTINYSLIGCRYDKYFDNVDKPAKLDPFKFYYAILEYTGGSFYSILDKLCLQDVKRTSFLNYLRNGTMQQQQQKAEDQR